MKYNCLHIHTSPYHNALFKDKQAGLLAMLSLGIGLFAHPSGKRGFDLPDDSSS